MAKRAPADHPIHDLIAERWSPVVFDECAVEPGTMLQLLEAARWSSSSFNEQPWTFIVGMKGQGDAWQGVLDCLVEPNQAWARHAPVLMISVAARAFARNDKPNAHAWYDVGQATANLAAQATSLGLVMHQMAGYVPEKARARFAIPATHDPVAAAAIGYEGDQKAADEALRKRDAAPRARKPLGDFVIGNAWGEAATFLP